MDTSTYIFVIVSTILVISRLTYHLMPMSLRADIHIDYNPLVGIIMGALTTIWCVSGIWVVCGLLRGATSPPTILTPDFNDGHVTQIRMTDTAGYIWDQVEWEAPTPDSDGLPIRYTHTMNAEPIPPNPTARD
jgi:hypothetical protein